MVHFPKLDVAGSNPVSRSIFSTTYEAFAHPPNPPFSCKDLIFRYLRQILSTYMDRAWPAPSDAINKVAAGALQVIDSGRIKL